MDNSSIKCESIWLLYTKNHLGCRKLNALSATAWDAWIFAEEVFSLVVCACAIIGLG
jgi:hypothetical protein